MKRIFTIIMIGILLVGCAKTDFLTEHDWVHYGSTCIETIYFGKDGHFAYYSDEGNPVNDSDLYDQYSYDSKSKKIHLKPTGDMSIQVLRYEKSRLRDLAYDKENITDGFSSYLAILKKDGSQIITAPANYDGDDPKFKEYELFERLADNVEYYSWTYNVDQSDVESSFTKLTDTEAFKIIEDGGAIGFVWYNKSAKITKIVFYSNVIIE